MRNTFLTDRTARDIDGQVARVLRDIGNPDPPLRLEVVRDVLKLDLKYYSSKDDGAVRFVSHRLWIAGKQMLLRPGLLFEAIKKLDVKALYLPDQKRILINSELPAIKQRWGESHEVGHSIIPWHADLMLGDTKQTLTPSCHEQIEAEANYAAARLLFLREKFGAAIGDRDVDLSLVRDAAKLFGNSITTTLWRVVEHLDVPAIGVVGRHPKLPNSEGDLAETCRYFVRSRRFSAQFSRIDEMTVCAKIGSYCSSARRGPLGSDEVLLQDDGGSKHVFIFETFYNSYEALTLGIYVRPQARSVAF